MASKQLLRRIPLLAREGWSSINAGALPEVAQDVLPIVASAGEGPRPGPTMQGPALVARPIQKPGPAHQTLGQWSQRLPHLQALQKPLSALGVTATADAPPLSAWSGLAAQHAGPTAASIAASTIPNIATLIHKQQQQQQQQQQPASTNSNPLLFAAADAAAAPLPPPAAATAATAPSADAMTAPAPLEPLAAAAAAQPAAAPSRPPAPAHPAHQHPPAPLQPQRRSAAGGRVSGSGGGGAASSSIALNKHIMACRTTEELLTLVQLRGGSFDYFNISTALARVPKLAAAAPPPSSTTTSGSGGGMPYGGPPPPPPPLPPSAALGGSSSFSSGHLSHAAVVQQFGGGGGGGGGDLHVDATGRLLLDHLAALMVANVHAFDARGLANSAWAFGKLKYVPSGGLPSVIASAALGRMGELSPQNLSNLVWAFVYMHHADEALLSAAARYVAARVTEFKPQELANIVWAFASLGHRDDRMLHAVASQAQRIAPLFKEQELSNVLWALGKMGLAGRREVVEALMAETRAKLPAFLPQGVSNVAWALASMGHNDTRFLDAVVGQCGRHLAAFDVQAMANLVWAMATLGYYAPPFVASVVGECLARGLDRLSPQHLSNILWAAATLGHRDSRMLSAWAAQTLEKLPSFEPQGLSNSAWAFARLGAHSPQLFAALAAAALHRIDGFNAQGLSNLAWAFATAGAAHPRLFEALSAAAVSQAPTFTAQHCSVTLWAAATLRHHDPRLLEVLTSRLLQEASKGAVEPQNVANTLWALARMGHALAPDAAAALVSAMRAQLPAMGQQELCNALWGAACLGLLDARLFNEACGHLARLLGGMSPEGMHQAYHAQLLLHSRLARDAGMPLSQLRALAAASDPAAAAALLPTLPEPLHTAAASMWAASARDVHVSRLHAEVSGALAAAGVPHGVEWVTDDEAFSLDIGLQVNAQPTAVEVNGSHHYASNPPHRPLGDMAVRRRLLEDRGWAVVDVGYAEWEAAGPTLADRGAALVRRIASALGDWDWRYAGLPQRSGEAGARAPPPLAVVTPPGGGGGGAVGAAGAALAAAAAMQEQAALQAAMAAAMGLGPLFADGDGAAAGLAAPQPQVPMQQRGGDEGAVEAAVRAAEALDALPGGRLLVAQQLLSVLGAQLPPSAAMALALQSATAIPTHATAPMLHHQHMQQQQQQAVAANDGGSVLAMAAALEHLAALQQLPGGGNGSGSGLLNAASSLNAHAASLNPFGTSTSSGGSLGLGSLGLTSYSSLLTGGYPWATTAASLGLLGGCGGGGASYLGPSSGESCSSSSSNMGGSGSTGGTLAGGAAGAAGARASVGWMEEDDGDSGVSEDDLERVVQYALA